MEIKLPKDVKLIFNYTHPTANYSLIGEDIVAVQLTNGLFVDLGHYGGENPFFVQVWPENFPLNRVQEFNCGTIEEAVEKLEEFVEHYESFGLVERNLFIDFLNQYGKIMGKCACNIDFENTPENKKFLKCVFSSLYKTEDAQEMIQGLDEGQLSAMDVDVF